MRATGERRTLLAQDEEEYVVHVVTRGRSWRATSVATLLVLGMVMLSISWRCGFLSLRIEGLMRADEESFKFLAPRKMLEVALEEIGAEGDETVSTRPVDFAESSLMSKDAFIVDDGVHVWLWIGKDASESVSVKGSDAAAAFADGSAIPGRKVSIVFQKENNDGNFRKALERTLATPQMFHVNLTVASDPGLTALQLDQASLISDSAFIIDTGNANISDSVYLWLGKDMKAVSSTIAKTTCSEYIQTTPQPDRVPHFVSEGKDDEAVLLALLPGKRGEKSGSLTTGIRGSMLALIAFLFLAI